MATPQPHEPRIFVDADVLFAGAASPGEHSASLVVLRLAEITLIEALTSRQVIVEAERNLAEKLPQALPTFRLLVSRCLRVVPDPQPPDLQPYDGWAHPKDLPILVAAIREDCPWSRSTSAIFNLVTQPSPSCVQASSCCTCATYWPV